MFRGLQRVRCAAGRIESTEGFPMLHPEKVRAYRAMSPEAKLRAASDLYWAARRLKEAAVRQRHPEWTDDEVRREVARIFLHARD